MPFVQLPSFALHYHQWGAGRPFLFLHGLGDSGLQAFELLGEAPGTSLVAPDFRGHGRTNYDGPPTGYRIPVFAEDVLALLDRLGLEKVPVIGLSLGAAVALNLAIRWPERVQEMLLLRPAWLNQPYPYNLDLFLLAGRLIAEKGVDAARVAFKESEEYGVFLEKHPEAADTMLALFRREYPGGVHGALTRLPGTVPFMDYAELRSVNMPVKVVTTQNDPFHPWNYGRLLAEGLPNSQLDQLPPRYRRPEEYFRELRGLGERFRRP